MHPVEEPPPEDIHLEKQIERAYEKIVVGESLSCIAGVLGGKGCVGVELSEVVVEGLVGKMQQIVLQSTHGSANLQLLVDAAPGEGARILAEEPDHVAGVPSAMLDPFSDEICAPRHFEAGVRC